MFKLNIECTKDISELHINFTDGTSAVVEGPKTDKTEETKKTAPAVKPKKVKDSNGETFRRDPREDMYDYDDTVTDVISKEVVKLPEIPEKNRAVKVASELHNLDF